MPSRAGPNAGNFPPLSLAEIAAAAANTGGPIAGHYEFNADGAGVQLRHAYLPMSRSIRETGTHHDHCATRCSRTPARPSIPTYVEGQFQGGAAQGIGWALNEEYIYGKDGRLQNAGLPRLPHPGLLRPADDRHA